MAAPSTVEAGSLQDKILKVIEPLIYGPRKINLLILLALTVMFAWFASGTRVDAGFDKSIPLDHPYMEIYKHYEAEFGGANTVLVALIQKDGSIYNEKFLDKLKAATDEVFFCQALTAPGCHRCSPRTYVTSRWSKAAFAAAT